MSKPKLTRCAECLFMMRAVTTKGIFWHGWCIRHAPGVGERIDVGGEHDGSYSCAWPHVFPHMGCGDGLIDCSINVKPEYPGDPLNRTWIVTQRERTEPV